MHIPHKGLTGFQVCAIVTLSVIGISVMFIPQRATHSSGVDGVLVTFIAGILSIVLAGMIILVSNQFPNKTIIKYSRQILGKHLGFMYDAIFVVYTLLASSYVLRGFADVIKIVLLPRTPLEVIMISMLLLILYCVQGGIAVIARICELFIIPILLVIFFTMFFNISEVELYRYRDTLSNGFDPILKGVTSVTISYLGYEILFFLIPFMYNKKKALISGLAGMISPIIVYTGLVFLSIGIIGALPTSELIYPTIHLARQIGVQFIERFDIFFIVFWILAVFTNLIVYIYMAAISLTRILHLRNYKPFISILIPVCYIIAILPQNVVQINLLADMVNYGGIFIVLSSVPLLALALLRKKGGRGSA